MYFTGWLEIPRSGSRERAECSGQRLSVKHLAAAHSLWPAAVRNSTAAAIGIPARELQGENIGKLPKIHQDIQGLFTPMQTCLLKPLARGLPAITKFAFPDGYLATGHEHLLKQHTINSIHNATPPDLRFLFDFETDFDWVS